jgi:DNA recombination protein RmuC
VISTSILVVALAGLVLVGLCVRALKFRASSDSGGFKQKFDELRIENAKMAALLQERNAQLRSSDERISRLEYEKGVLEKNKIALEVRENNLNEKIDEFQNIRSLLLEEFKETSQKVLQETAKTHASRLNGEVIEPFSARLGDFKKALVDKMKEVNDATIDSKARLEQQLSDLKKASESLHNDSAELTKALRGNKKLQGNWAEIQIERMFEIAGWKEGVEYEKQKQYKTDENETQIPDYIVNLPGNKTMVIDAKTTLNSYADYIKEDDELKKKQHLKEFVNATKRHIDELSAKKYQKLFGDKLSYVFMFMPLEHAYLEALNEDNSLFDYAYERHIAIATPSLLFPMLRTVESLWNIEKQNKGVEKIVEYAKTLYAKCCGFVEDFQNIGKCLGKAKDSYDDAYKKLSTGKGNVIRLLEKIRTEGGIPVSKKIEIPYEGNEEDEEKI